MILPRQDASSTLPINSQPGTSRPVATVSQLLPDTATTCQLIVPICTQAEAVSEASSAFLSLFPTAPTTSALISPPTSTVPVNIRREASLHVPPLCPLQSRGRGLINRGLTPVWRLPSSPPFAVADDPRRLLPRLQLRVPPPLAVLSPLRPQDCESTSLHWNCSKSLHRILFR